MLLLLLLMLIHLLYLKERSKIGKVIQLLLLRFEGEIRGRLDAYYSVYTICFIADFFISIRTKHHQQRNN
jgi:hypothetical protein